MPKHAAKRTITIDPNNLGEYAGWVTKPEDVKLIGSTGNPIIVEKFAPKASAYAS
ncbi:MAG: hypothetical protein Q9170_002415 [Blastenia crenularia]